MGCLNPNLVKDRISGSMPLSSGRNSARNVILSRGRHRHRQDDDGTEFVYRGIKEFG